MVSVQLNTSEYLELQHKMVAFENPSQETPEVATLVSGELPAGVHQKVWDASRHAIGLYFYRLQAGTYSETKRMYYVK